MMSNIINPYAKKKAIPPLRNGGSSNEEIPPLAYSGPRNQQIPPSAGGTSMGIQSQRRVVNSRALRQKLPHQTIKKTPKGRGLIQRAITGGEGFDPIRHCVICRAKAYGLNPPKRAHHALCTNNKRTRGKPRDLYLQEKAEEQRLSNLWKPLNQEKSVPDHKGIVGYFGTRNSLEITKSELPPSPIAMDGQSCVPCTPSPSKGGANDQHIKSEEPNLEEDLLEFVAKMACDDVFKCQFKKGSAPIAVLATAKFLNDKVLPKQVMSRAKKKAHETFRSEQELARYRNFFRNEMYFTIPREHRGQMESLDESLHSMAGTKIYLVHWELLEQGLHVPCPLSGCEGILEHDRTNFSKNRNLFPLFNLDGAPDWAIVMKYKCNCCAKWFNANDGEVLQSLPGYIRNRYPVYPRYASGSARWHLTKSASDYFEETILTYGNGEFFSRILYNAINKSYLTRLEDYLSYHLHKRLPCKEYPDKDGEYISCSLPSGSALRKLYEDASKSPLNYLGISDDMRHTREIQSVTAKKMFAQDHTMEVVKNYQAKLGAFAIWDCATETGEIASAVMVPSTKQEDFAHAAEALARRPGFTPSVMYSDTWPHGEKFWYLLFGDTLKGRMGLFHYSHAIVQTLRQNHIDYKQAVWDLMMSMYTYVEKDLNSLLEALTSGTMSQSGHKYSHAEIQDLMMNTKFKNRYSKNLRKRILPEEVIKKNLRDWFDKYKVDSTTPGSAPGRGRLDPYSKKKLFTPETRDVVQNKILKAGTIQDPLPVEEMYDEIKPGPRSRHNLSEFLSLRGESRLEGFHDPLSHFANSGMRATLADSLNLAGTARYNVLIRHKIWIQSLPREERGKMSVDMEMIPSCWNHSQLQFINDMAKRAGLATVPFPNARQLPKDNGERFFSQYLLELRQRKQSMKAHALSDRCQCRKCAGNEVPLPHRENLKVVVTDDCPADEDFVAEQNEMTDIFETSGDINKVVDALRQKETPQTQRSCNQKGSAYATPTPPTDWAIPNSPYLPWAFHNFPMQFQNAGAVLNQHAVPISYPRKRAKLQVEYCCKEFIEWSMKPKRNGRPPHNRNCYRR